MRFEKVYDTTIFLCRHGRYTVRVSACPPKSRDLMRIIPAKAAYTGVDNTGTQFEVLGGIPGFLKHPRQRFKEPSGEILLEWVNSNSATLFYISKFPKELKGYVCTDGYAIWRSPNGMERWLRRKHLCICCGAIADRRFSGHCARCATKKDLEPAEGKKHPSPKCPKCGAWMTYYSLGIASGTESGEWHPGTKYPAYVCSFKRCSGRRSLLLSAL